MCLPPGVSVPVEAVQGLARHNVKEYTRWREFLPRIYAELGPEHVLLGAALGRQRSVNGGRREAVVIPPAPAFVPPL